MPDNEILVVVLKNENLIELRFNKNTLQQINYMMDELKGIFHDNSWFFKQESEPKLESFFLKEKLLILRRAGFQKRLEIQIKK